MHTKVINIVKEIKAKIRAAAVARFSGQRVAVRCPCGYTEGLRTGIDGMFEVLVGPEGEHCYAVVERGGGLDFEQRD